MINYVLIWLKMLIVEGLMNSKVIIIAGPTASGKSKLAIHKAQELNGVIINADSMQVYKNTPIISAVPSIEEKQLVEHRLYEIYDNIFNGTVVDWLDLAVAEIRDVWAKNQVPIVVGGTGMYIDNLINGTTPIPEVLPEIRKQAYDILQNGGLSALYEELIKIDVKAAKKLSPNDSTRVRRAYEIMLQTGISVSEWYEKPMIKKLPEAEFDVYKIIPDMKELEERCYKRFDVMMQLGALEEVKFLHGRNLDRNLPSMKMLGVPELLSYLDGYISIESAIDLAKLHTRQYAKRQLTWFRNKLITNNVIYCCF